MGCEKKISSEDIATISAAYHAVKKNAKDGAVVGADRLMDILPPHIKRSPLKKVHAGLKAGKTALDITFSQEESRKWADDKRAASAGDTAEAGKLLGENKSALENSRRPVSQKLKVGKSAVNRIAKKWAKNH